MSRGRKALWVLVTVPYAHEIASIATAAERRTFKFRGSVTLASRTKGQSVARLSVNRSVLCHHGSPVWVKVGGLSSTSVNELLLQGISISYFPVVLDRPGPDPQQTYTYKVFANPFGPSVSNLGLFYGRCRSICDKTVKTHQFLGCNVPACSALF